MNWFLAAVSVLAALAALRAWQAARHLRRESPVAPPPAPAPAPPPVADDVAPAVEEVRAACRKHHGSLETRAGRLESRIEALEAAGAALEQRVLDLASREARLEQRLGAPPAEEPPPPLATRVRELLRREGYERFVVLERAGDAPDAVAIEVARGGRTEKGWAHLDDAGRIRLELRPTTRVFP